MLNKELLLMGAPTPQLVDVSITFYSFPNQEQSITYTDANGELKTEYYFDERTFCSAKFQAPTGTIVTFVGNARHFLTYVYPENIKVEQTGSTYVIHLSGTVPITISFVQD